METDNKPRGNRGRLRNKTTAPPAEEKLNISRKTQAPPPLHLACLDGQLLLLRRLLSSGSRGQIDAGDAHGRRPVHLLLTPLSSPHTCACLRLLLQNGAQVNVSTDSGLTPLHMAASEGLRDCVEVLVRAGADVSARERLGLTALDLARIWGHREVARFLKCCVWEAEKKKETEEKRLAEGFYRDLVSAARRHRQTLREERQADWTDRKGLPLLHKRFLTHRLSSNQEPGAVSESGTRKSVSDPDPGNRKSVSDPEPGTRKSVSDPESGARRSVSDPDLRDSVRLWRDRTSGLTWYVTRWEREPRVAPDLPLDVLQRALFPETFRSRTLSPQDILQVQHKGGRRDRNRRTWSEVALHLPQVLEPGHY